MKKIAKGFTLIELLIVILIISVLAVSVFVALNPQKRLADSRNSRRWSDVSTILTAIHEYIIDNGGTAPAGLTSEVQLGTSGTGCATPCTGAATACKDMTSTLASYLKSIPVDPSGTAAKTGYSVVIDANGIVTVSACQAENAVVISASR